MIVHTQEAAAGRPLTPAEAAAEARNIAAIAKSPYVNQIARTPGGRLCGGKSAAAPDNVPFSSYEISPYKLVVSLAGHMAHQFSRAADQELERNNFVR
eukprot:scaffold64223_cov14-Tisochrysis_lutea.AAC.2